MEIDNRPWLGAATDPGVVDEDLDLAKCLLGDNLHSTLRSARSAEIATAMPPAEWIVATT